MPSSSSHLNVCRRLRVCSNREQKRQESSNIERVVYEFVGHVHTRVVYVVYNRQRCAYSCKCMCIEHMCDRVHDTKMTHSITMHISCCHTLTHVRKFSAERNCTAVFASSTANTTRTNAHGIVSNLLRADGGCMFQYACVCVCTMSKLPVEFR